LPSRPSPCRCWPDRELFQPLSCFKIKPEISPQHIALYGCILGVSLASYLVLRVSARGARWLNPIAMNVAIRIMGLLLAAVAIQFMVNAIKTLRFDLAAPPTM
jgi:small neutral amino acid transporter SnatA (MarC family)